MNPLVPFDRFHGPHAVAEASFPILPLFGGVLLLVVLLALGSWLLWRRGILTLPRFAAESAPEDDAKRILADRFAHGDISGEEFIERASMLNWTPGVAASSTTSRRSRR